MNRQNFEAKDRFPLSTQALSFMQDMVFATAQLALIGGDNYILSGCTVSGGSVSDGVIVVAGEPIPFKGGAAVATITIVEENVSVSANGLTFDRARTLRYAKFATGSGSNYLNWADFKPLKTNKQLEEAKATVKYVDDEVAKIQAGSIPTGVIVMWSGDVSEVPQGWQLCDNSLIPGTNNKRTPDLRGKFIVGYNNDDVDYDVVGKVSGEKQVKLSLEQIPSHSHKVKDYYFSERHNVGGLDGTDYSPNASIGSGDSDNDNHYLYYKIHDTEVTGGSMAHENRPPYYVLAFIIKL